MEKQNLLFETDVHETFLKIIKNDIPLNSLSMPELLNLNIKIINLDWVEAFDYLNDFLKNNGFMSNKDQFKEIISLGAKKIFDANIKNLNPLEIRDVLKGFNLNNSKNHENYQNYIYFYDNIFNKFINNYDDSFQNKEFVEYNLNYIISNLIARKSLKSWDQINDCVNSISYLSTWKNKTSIIIDAHKNNAMYHFSAKIHQEIIDLWNTSEDLNLINNDLKEIFYKYDFYEDIASKISQKTILKEVKDDIKNSKIRKKKM